MPPARAVRRSDRAEERNERFTGYSEHRAADAERAQKAVAAIADGIPFGQPILVGHHSERRARKDAEKIENGMRRAVKLWDTSTYWTDRAAGAIRHAKHKERPDVRARRIKGLEADKRKQERIVVESTRFQRVWNHEGLTEVQARLIADRDRISFSFTTASYPTEVPRVSAVPWMLAWSTRPGRQSLQLPSMPVSLLTLPAGLLTSPIGSPTSGPCLPQTAEDWPTGTSRRRAALAAAGLRRGAAGLTSRNSTGFLFPCSTTTAKAGSLSPLSSLSTN